MSGDYSRRSFDPLNGYTATWLEQGRVALDSDWNEWVESIERRLRMATVDTIGRAVVPNETPDGFKIAADANQALTIGRGRMYVSGILAENHGDQPQRFDLVEPGAGGRDPLGVIGDLVGTDTVRFLEQPFLSAGERPYLPEPDPMPDGAGPHLIYLDVWQREVTYVEDPGLLESALGGVDTSTRLQTVWQVRMLANAGAESSCATPDAEVQGYREVTRRSAGRLTTREMPVVGDDDPCLIPAAAGYRGLENQLYRVEIHRAGGLGNGARFKWSRENASVATRVEAITALDKLVIKSVGRDEFLRIKAGDWIEITDEKRELSGRSGDLRKVKLVEDSSRTVVLTSPMDADLQPGGVGLDTLENRRTRIRKWDQQGTVLDQNGDPLVDLDAAANESDPVLRGTIPLPPAGTEVQLEAGIVLRFDLQPANGTFRVGDYWNFAARAATGTFEKLDAAPPLGIHHHYARLAMLTFPGPPQDCRVIWPPLMGGETCACDVCVSPEDHNSQRMTIQRAVDLVQQTGGTVCLQAGDYLIREAPIRIHEGTSVRIVGKGSKTVLIYMGDGAALQVEYGKDIDIRDLTFAYTSRRDRGSGGLSITSSTDLVIEGCYFVELRGAKQGSSAIELAGLIFNARIRNNVINSAHGIIARTANEAENYLIAADVTIAENRFFCQERGIDLSGRAAYYDSEVRIEDNLFRDSARAAINVVLAVLNEDVPTPVRMRIGRNMLLYGLGNAIVAGGGLVEVAGNTIQGLRKGGQFGSMGIALVPTPDQFRVRDCRIVDNVITDVIEDAILIDARCDNLTVTGNTVTRIGGAGLFFSLGARATCAVIEGNQMRELSMHAQDRQSPRVGIFASGCDHLRLTGNVVDSVAPDARDSLWFAGMEIAGCRLLRVENNDVRNIGPPNFDGLGFGMLVGGFADAMFSENRIRQTDTEVSGRAPWYGLVAIESIAARFKTYAKAALASRRAVFVGSGGVTLRFDAHGISSMLRLDAGRTCVHENTVVGGGDGNDGMTRLVLISAQDLCQLQGNVFEMTPESPAESVAEIQALVTQASNNRVVRRSDSNCLHINSRAYTVVGNVTTSSIWVGPNEDPLPSPWDVLNIRI